MKIDYSLYLVTDSTPAILGDRDLFQVVEEAIRGGVTVVQYRDKKSDTAHLIATASKLHSLTSKHDIPLIINDRVDVALAVGAEGAHLGQDDINVSTARRVLGDEAIIGVSACSLEEASQAVADGADYLGIGTIFGTATKTDTNSIIGTTGLRNILSHLPQALHRSGPIPTVCIGGLNASNVQRVLWKSQPMMMAQSPKPGMGAAVVSAIMSSNDPCSTAKHLRRLITTPPPFARPIPRTEELSLTRVASIWQRLISTKPLSHNMTNTVVQNFAANVNLAIGSSPIMSMNPAEAADLAAIPNAALVINMGTLTTETLNHYKIALSAYNALGRPVVLDPVGGGATVIRRNAVRELLNAGHFDVIKGNEAEIRTVWREGLRDRTTTSSNDRNEEVHQHGVDSGQKVLNDSNTASLVQNLARRERCVVLMTGATDFLSDGHRTCSVKNGVELLGTITGSGCSLGAVIGSFLSAERAQSEQDSIEDPLVATLAGVLAYEIAAERVKANGPGSFLSGFLDQLYLLKSSVQKGEVDFVQAARVEMIRV